jgi:pimeloyl-ACP methyl ester carboxylesterase
VSFAVAVRRRRWWWLTGAVVVLVTAAVVALVTGGRADSAPRAAALVRPGPVVLVPGYGGGTDSLDQLATRLRAAGHRTTVLNLVGDGTGDLNVQARLLQTTVDGLLTGGAASVDVVGYSAGGVVARLWADQLGGAAHARRIVLLGSPNHGTDVAALAAGFGTGLCPAACEQLVPGSPLLRGLADAGASKGPGWVSIWTDQDQVVTPPESARLDGAANLTVQSVCPGDQVDHGSLPTDPVVQDLVVRALAVDPFAVPTVSC